ncbi:MAG: regulatory signaling modulator protein AmpE [Gammaproteobacteria bacterium]|nr:regulatory signaling modulator protein AmpE [Gammaproteobacteria bacterium]MDH5660794.1 regulatory signaling modulator protein AmpE [Gammaproteobacteria bacterium]
MSLLSVIFALIAENFISSLSELRRFDFFFRYVNWMRAKLPAFSFQNGSVTLIIVISGILFTVWLISAMLGNVLGLFGFLFGIAVLIFSIGPRNLEEDVQKINAAFENNDYEAANFYTSDLVNHPVSEPPMALAHTVKVNILLQANIRMLGVFFWFIILGPVGAVLFRLTCLLKENQQNEDDDFAKASRELYKILNWLPARICVLSYAVAGNFVDTMSYWNGVSDLWLRDSEDFIIVSGVGALRYVQRIEKDQHGNEEPDIAGIQHALSLVKRAVIVWVVLLGLLTVTGWLV